MNSKSFKRTYHLAIVSLMVGIGASACLKTRAQLREDPSDHEEHKPVPVQPAQEVEPQGKYAIDEIKAEFTRLEGRVEDIERNQKGLTARSNLAEDLKKLEERIAHLEQGQASIQEALAKLQESSALADPNELFKKAQSQFDAEDYEGAAETLSLYLKSPKVKRPEDATFMKAEAFYRLKQYKKAIVEYSKFPEKFTRSNKMPEALYKIGLSFEALGMRDEAKGFFQDLVEKYPKSPEAKKARKKAK